MGICWKHRQTMESANIRVHLPGLIVKTAIVTQATTLQEILNMLELPNIFTFYNEGETPMPDLHKNLVDYNNWYIDKGGYLPSLYLR